MKKLVIVESPAKARTIKNFLGSEYTVIASRGHLRDLPKSSFGIKIEDGVFTPEYRVPKDSSATVKEIRDLAKKSETIYIATDEDREGEAIGYHIACAIKKDPTSLPRIVFHEITKSAIKHAIDHPRTIDMNSVDAQQARRLLDRIVGYRLSPLLASKIQKGLSAGRVQSSSLKIVIDREREIKKFKPVEFWAILGIFNKDIESTLYEYESKKLQKLSIKNEKQATDIKEVILKGQYKISDIETKTTTTSSPAPFMTSSLQQTASSILGFTPKKTMMIAQKLYEGVKTKNGVMGLITYMRTDSLNLSKEAVDKARKEILKNFGKEYLPSKPKIYATKSKGAQEAHEAIRPTIVDLPPAQLKNYLSPDEFKLYSLIYNRFIATQMNNAKFESQNIIFSSKNVKFKASGRRLVFPGFYKIMGNNAKDKLLPKLNIGDKASLDDLKVDQNFTEPPPRYSEASLIKKLEELGIGRPSTYAPTISTLQMRKYINIEKRKILPSEIAFTVIELLEQHFPEIVDSSFTSNMESELDKVAIAKANWQEILHEFYIPFNDKIQNGKKNIKSQKKMIPTGEMCPECDHELVIRSGRYGDFTACSNFPKCRYIKKDPNKVKKALVTIGVSCPECSKDLVERSSRRGKFFGCSGYPKCKFVSNDTPVSEICKSCGYKVMLEDKNGKRTCPKCNPPVKKTRTRKKRK